MVFPKDNIIYCQFRAVYISYYFSMINKTQITIEFHFLILNFTYDIYVFRSLKVWENITLFKLCKVEPFQLKEPFVRIKENAFP